MVTHAWYRNSLTDTSFLHEVSVKSISEWEFRWSRVGGLHFCTPWLQEVAALQPYEILWAEEAQEFSLILLASVCAGFKSCKRNTESGNSVLWTVTLEHEALELSITCLWGKPLNILPGELSFLRYKKSGDQRWHAVFYQTARASVVRLCPASMRPVSGQINSSTCI